MNQSADDFGIHDMFFLQTRDIFIQEFKNGVQMSREDVYQCVKEFCRRVEVDSEILKGAAVIWRSTSTRIFRVNK